MLLKGKASCAPVPRRGLAPDAALKQAEENDDTEEEDDPLMGSSAASSPRSCHVSLPMQYVVSCSLDVHCVAK